jgi:hypothetical protein
MFIHDKVSRYCNVFKTVYLGSSLSSILREFRLVTWRIDTKMCCVAFGAMHNGLCLGLRECEIVSCCT